MKSNSTPSTHVALCRSDQLVRLNVHLRRHGIDARVVKDPKVGSTIKVPPERRAEAQGLRDAWLEQILGYPTDDRRSCEEVCAYRTTQPDVLARFVRVPFTGRYRQVL